MFRSRRFGWCLKYNVSTRDSSQVRAEEKRVKFLENIARDLCASQRFVDLSGMAMWSFPDCGSCTENKASKKSRS